MCRSTPFDFKLDLPRYLCGRRVRFRWAATASAEFTGTIVAYSKDRHYAFILDDKKPSLSARPVRTNRILGCV